ncbi:hypothetical protein N7450_003760 [Penicillium hetheringtonii]|uniref:Uncharacterized protein n=1 Tax=Penicillium hetheringtonii TaxID=911720 RepID=A0AAD6DNT0_9EURO|nr:hypothetical protein N7450_003760 [Penicillium hetheringtonii]
MSNSSRAKPNQIDPEPNAFRLMHVEDQAQQRHGSGKAGNQEDTQDKAAANQSTRRKDEGKT